MKRRRATERENMRGGRRKGKKYDKYYARE
jgi:hypothetical protein